MRARILAGALPLIALALIDVALHVVGLVPPRDPTLLERSRNESAHWPFVEGPGGVFSIAPDWEARDNRLRVRPGSAPGEFFLFPTFRPARVVLPKPDGVIRIFVIGGSTVFGLYVGEPVAFPAVLGRALESELRLEVEVVNLGAPGWTSDRVAELQATALRMDPDLVVVYAGHNELLGGGSPATREGALVRARRGLVSVSAIAAWLDHWLMAARGGVGSVREEDALRRARDARVRDATSIPRADRTPPGTAEVAAIGRSYHRALARMVSAGRRAGVPHLFVLPVANLVFPPVPGPPDAPDEARWVDSVAREAQAALARGEHREAGALIDTAARAAPGNATVRYQRGLALLYFGDLERGISELEVARDLDSQQHRIRSELEREFLDSMRGSGGTWLDPRPAFRTSDALERSEDLFIDHVHPTQHGHAVLAREICPVALDALRRAADDDLDLENRIDERGECGALGEDQERAHQEQDH